MMLTAYTILVGCDGRKDVERMLNYKKQCTADLLDLVTTQNEWVKVHAAEFLVWETELNKPVKQQFDVEDANFGDRSPYRIGIWRVLSQASSAIDERERWIAKIVDAYHDPNSTDKLHAVETLAKLGHPVIQTDELNSLLDAEVNPLNLYRLWNVSRHPGTDLSRIQTHLVAVIEDLIQATDFGGSLAVSSYILRYLGPLPTALWYRLNESSDALLIDPKSHANVMATLWITQADGLDISSVTTIKDALLAVRHDPEFANHFFMASAAHPAGLQWEDIASLYDRYSDASLVNYDPDLHASAAYALLRVVDVTTVHIQRAIKK